MSHLSFMRETFTLSIRGLCQLPALYARGVDLARLRLRMTENRHDLLLAAAQLGEEFGKPFAHSMCGQMVQAGGPARALEHRRLAVSA